MESGRIAQVFFGDPEKPPPKWREEPDDEDPDDEELPETPPDVVAMLGFDPLEVARSDDAEWQEEDHPRDQEGKFTSGGGGTAAKLSPGSPGYEAKPLPPETEQRYRQYVEEGKQSIAFTSAMREYHESLQGFKALKARINDPNSTWSDFEALRAHQERHAQITKDMYGLAPYNYFKYVAALRKHDVDVRVIEKTVKPIRTETLKIAKKMGFPADQVQVTYNKRQFTLNGKVHNYAGSAVISMGERGNITMYARNLSPKTVPGVAAHEIEHIRYAGFQEKRESQYKEAMLESSKYGPPNEHNPVMNWDGVLKPPYDQKYPEWNAWSKQRKEWGEADIPEGFKGVNLLAASDGVTKYSAEWWDNYHANPNQTTFEQAVHETLAEMMSEREEKGALPEHSWAGPMPRHNVSVEYPQGFATTEGVDRIMAAGKTAWRKLFATVNKE